VNLGETARVAEAAAQLEEATFALLGAWVPSEPDPAAKALLAEHALHHAWHSSLWRERVPDGVGVQAEPAKQGESPISRVVAILGSLAAQDPGGRPQRSAPQSTTTERLVGVYAVLAEARRGAYRDLMASLSAASDGPLIRALTLIVDDQERDRRAGVDLLESMTEPSDVASLGA
jgi:hypothetical protein